MSVPGSGQKRRRFWQSLGTVRRSSDRRLILSRRVAASVSILLIVWEIIPYDWAAEHSTVEKLCSIATGDVPLKGRGPERD